MSLDSSTSSPALSCLHRCATAAFLFLCAGCSSVSSRPTTAAPDFVDLRDGPVVIPMDLRSGRPVLQVYIDGQGPFPFVFDTGNPGRTILEEDLFKRLELPDLGKEWVGGPINPDSIRTTVTEFDSFVVGGLKMKGVTAMAWHRPPMFHGRDAAQGILSRRVFASCLLTIDYGKRRLIVQRGELPEPDGKTVFGWRAAEIHPTVPIRLGELTLRAHIDSGNPSDVLLHTSHEARLPPVLGRVIRRQAQTANGEFELRRMRLDATLRIGDLAFRRPRIGISEAIVHPNIGGSILRRLVITLDQRNRRIRLQMAGE